MVLPGKLGGRVGRRRNFFKPGINFDSGFFCFSFCIAVIYILHPETNSRLNLNCILKPIRAAANTTKGKECVT